MDHLQASFVLVLQYIINVLLIEYIGTVLLYNNAFNIWICSGGCFLDCIR